MPTYTKKSEQETASVPSALKLLVPAVPATSSFPALLMGAWFGCSASLGFDESTDVLFALASLN